MNNHRGSDFSDFLIDEGLMPEVQVLALKRLIALQIHEALAEANLTKTQLAHRMKTSRAALDRIPLPTSPRER